MLASHFVAGLQSDIKMKPAGSDGDLDLFLTRAKFEEAKNRDMGEHTGKSGEKRKSLEEESSQSNTTQQGFHRRSASYSACGYGFPYN